MKYGKNKYFQRRKIFKKQKEIEMKGKKGRIKKCGKNKGNKYY